VNSTLKIAANAVIVLREGKESSYTKKGTRHKNSRLGEFLTKKMESKIMH
jgi:hypothetical protein